MLLFSEATLGGKGVPFEPFAVRHPVNKGSDEVGSLTRHALVRAGLEEGSNIDAARVARGLYGRQSMVRPGGVVAKDLRCVSTDKE